MLTILPFLNKIDRINSSTHLASKIQQPIQSLQDVIHEESGKVPAMITGETMIYPGMSEVNPESKTFPLFDSSSPVPDITICERVVHIVPCSSLSGLYINCFWFKSVFRVHGGACRNCDIIFMCCLCSCSI